MAAEPSQPKGWSDAKKWAMGILSALVVAATVQLVKSCGWREPDPIRVAFVATNEESPFAFRGRFEGTAEVSKDAMVVRIDKATIAYPGPSPVAEPRRIHDLRVSLVKARDGSWEPIRSSSHVPVGHSFTVGDRLELDPFEVRLDLTNLDSLSGGWLTVDMAETIPNGGMGYSYAHTRRDLF